MPILRHPFLFNARSAGGALLCACLQAVLMPQQSQAGEFMTVGVGQVPTAARKDCPRFELITDEFDNEEDAQKNARAFMARNELIDKRIDLMRPGQVVIVYRYQSTSPAFYGACVFTKYAFVQGDDADDATRKLAEHAAEFPKYFLSAPETVKQWSGRGFLRKVKRIYDGVEITYESRKGSSSESTHVMARIHNPYQDKAVRVFFRINGTLRKNAVLLDPRQMATVPLGRDVEHFGAAVQLLEPAKQAVKPDAILIKVITNKLRDEVTTQRGMMKASDSGIRG